MKKIAALLVLWCLRAEAQNYHEHLVMYPSSEAILGALDSQAEHGRLNFSFELVPDKVPRAVRAQLVENLAAHLKAAGASSMLQQFRQLTEGGGHVDVTSANWKQLRPMVEAYLSVPQGLPEGFSGQKGSYQLAEKLRVSALNSDPSGQVLARSFQDTFLKQKGKGPLELTVPIEFLTESGGSEQKRLKEFERIASAAKNNGVDLKYHLSFPRLQLDDAHRLNCGSGSKTQCLETFLRARDSKGSPLFGGVDIVGSIREGQGKDKYKAKTLQANLDQIKRIQRERGSPVEVRFHAFEGRAGGGAFYDDLHSSLSNPQYDDIPVRVGHIAQLDTSPGSETMKAIKGRCARKPGCGVVFEVNFVSNEFLHGSQSDDLLRKVHSLMAEGFVVLPGSDGEGILNGAGTEDLIARLKKRYPGDPMVDSVIEKLKQTQKKNYLNSVRGISPQVRSSEYLDDLAKRFAHGLCQ